MSSAEKSVRLRKWRTMPHLAEETIRTCNVGVNPEGLRKLRNSGILGMEHPENVTCALKIVIRAPQV